MRQAAATDFNVEVEGVGAFRFGRRSMRDEMRVGAEFSRLTEGVEAPTPWLELVAGVIAALKVLTVEAPDGWDVDAMDPLDQDTYDKLLSVHAALRAKEEDFRRSKSKASEKTGQVDGGDTGVLVSP